MNLDSKYLLKTKEGNVIGYFQNMKYYPNKTLSPGSYDAVIQEDGSLIGVNSEKVEGRVSFVNHTYTRLSDGTVFQIEEEKV